MMKALVVALACATATPAFAANVCTGLEKETILRHFFGQSVDLKAKDTKTLARQFRDQTIKAYPDPDAIAAAHITIPKLMQIRGVTTQMGFYPGAYRYDVKNEGGVAVIEVRVQLKDGTPAEHAYIANRVQGAEDIWNASKPKMGFPYKFRFRLVDTQAEALYRVHVKPNTRGPYFKNWDSTTWWTPRTQAHELGHMMGLADEYEGISGSTKNCSPYSLWCDDEGGQIEPYHYYMVLRRVVMQASGCKAKGDDD